MNYSLQINFLLCLINLLDLRTFGTEAANYHGRYHEDYDADSADHYGVVIPMNGCGCHKHTYSSDSDDDSSSLHHNEILIENTKHFHEHNHNYLLIGLDSGEEASITPEESSSYEYIRRIEKPLVEEEEEEEELDEDEYDELKGNGIFDIDPPRPVKAKKTYAPSTCEKRVHSAINEYKVNGGHGGHLKPSRRNHINVPQRTRALEYDSEYGHDLTDDILKTDQLEDDYEDLV